MNRAGAPRRSAYDATFFNRLRDGSRKSADVIVPMLMELLRPRSVVDVGCGTAVWLSVFSELGVDDIMGVDGPWVDVATLEIPADRFIQADLNQPFATDRKFDLVLSVETAEHLRPERAKAFVHDLAALGDIVVFSAAIPHQGGTAHLNEQWPAYWQALFAEEGHRAIDCLRPRLWNNESVGWWYAQNLCAYVSEARLSRDIRLRQLAKAAPEELLPLVHPRKYLETVAECHAAQKQPASIRGGIRQIARAIANRWR